MPTRVLIIIPLFIVITSYSQSQKFKITKTKFFNSTTKKTVWDSTHTGEIEIVFKAHSINIIYNGKWNIFYYNNSEPVFLDRDSLLYQRFNLKDIPTQNENVKVWISAIGGWDNSDIGEIIHTKANITTSYYINMTKEDEGYTPFDIIDYIRKQIKINPSDWVYLMSSNKGELWFTRYEPISNDGIITIWIRQLLPTFKWKGVNFTNVECKCVMKFDCNKKEIYTAEQHYYNNKGDIILSQDDYGSWERVIPESIGEGVLGKICELFKK